MAARKQITGKVQTKRLYNARPDTLDFRDRLYRTSLVEVPQETSLETYRAIGVPVLDQGEQGACTGFALATVCHFLLRTRSVRPDRVSVSPYMLYEMARRYDEWPGEAYAGSSARGAMKGWHKHGVCRRTLWRHTPDGDAVLTARRAEDAVTRPLGAYFRVPHNDLVAMHAAQAEAGILYATATVHTGWQGVTRRGRIRFEKDVIGGHAFVIVAYDAAGFWIQNSWGRSWGKGGFGHLSYDDWLENGSDVWVARLAVPVKVRQRGVGLASSALAARQPTSYAHGDIRPHVISIGNDGRLRDSGTYGTSAREVRMIINEDIPRITADWPRKRILLYAHGGLVSEKAAIRRVADYRQQFLDAEVYPLTFSWKSDYWTTLKNMLKDAFDRRREEGLLDRSKDFMLDRLDDTLEPIARLGTGRAQWKEMKENALLATCAQQGGARLVAELLTALVAADSRYELHVMAHSAGAVLQAPLVQLLCHAGPVPGGPMAGESGFGIGIRTCTLMAPACTMKLFDASFLPCIQSGAIDRFTLFTLRDGAEQDDNLANIYHKSLLYLVSNALEDKARIPLVSNHGEPLLGMEKFVKRHTALLRLVREADNADWIRAPNDEPEGSHVASRARRHSKFDDDPCTVQASLARILGKGSVNTAFSFAHSPEFHSDLRKSLG